MEEVQENVQSDEQGQPPPPVTLITEDHPDNEDVTPDLEEHLRHPGDPALLNGSSGNFGSAGAKSAPSTPQGIFSTCNSSLGIASGATGGLVINTLGVSGQASSAPLPDVSGHVSQPCTPGCTSPSIQRSPSHSVFTKCDKASLKNLSTSTPVMTAQGQLTEPPSPKAAKEVEKRPASKGHQKKFERHFQNVDDEKVLNHYVCALIGDILLQGHLYITANYFAFYSNVFGYVTKLLIPVLSVENITKEKTARIIPNAVGVKTSEDKHVFGSLMSRDSTLAYMTNVWNKVKEAQPVPEPEPEPEPIPDEIEGSSSESADGSEDAEGERDSPLLDSPTEISATARDSCLDQSSMSDRRSSQGIIQTIQQVISEFSKLPRQNLILFATTLLLILLFLSASILLYRINKIQDRYSLVLKDYKGSDGGDVYSNLLQWQSHLHSKSAGAVNSFLDNNLDQIAKVRQSLEALSMLLVSINSQKSSSEHESTPPTTIHKGES